MTSRLSHWLSPAILATILILTADAGLNPIWAEPLELDEITVPTSALWQGVREHRVEANGISMRVLAQGAGPAVLLLHGFPDLAITWRHQMKALSARGYRVIAPDLRGFGGSSAPPLTEDYDTLDVCADAVALLTALGEDRAVLIAHDWGAAHAWHCVRLEPERFVALVAMSVPLSVRSDRSPIERMREAVGGRFFYMLYFQEPGVAEAELEGDTEGLFRKLFASPRVTRLPPRISEPKVSTGGWLARIGLPTEPSPWFSERDLRYYVETFRATGFRGGLSYYRNLDRNWRLTERLHGTRIQIPTLFIVGESDPVLGTRDAATIEQQLRSAAVDDLRGVRLLPGAGHWAHLEQPDLVNQWILDFLAEASASPPAELPAGED
ncbi:MAG: alpha/beta hydrolase [Acidobacteriota bacterium]